MPLYAPAQWARRAQADDQRRVAQASADDIRRQVAVAAAQAYLSVIAAHRVVEAQQRSRDTAKAFFDYAHERFKAGASSRLNELRAQQTLSGDEALSNRRNWGSIARRRRLGVLLAADHPIDATNEPAFDIPAQADAAATGQSVGLRTDIKLFAVEVEAARRVVDDSSKEWHPTLNGIFEPVFQEPGSVFTPEASWRALLQFSVPLFDSGARKGRRLERQAALQQSEVDADRRPARRRLGDPGGLRERPPQRAGAAKHARCRRAGGASAGNHQHQLPRRRDDQHRSRSTRNAARATPTRPWPSPKTRSARLGWTCSTRSGDFPSHARQPQRHRGHGERPEWALHDDGMHLNMWLTPRQHEELCASFVFSVTCG